MACRALRLLAIPVAAAALGCATSRPAGPAAPPQTLPPTPEPAAALRALQHDIDSMIAAPQFRNAHWGILIVDPDHGDTLYSHNAGKLFMPASNMKIITGAVALAQLGPEFVFRTAVLAGGPVCDGVLRGDLVVSGRGDPSVSDAMRGDAMIPMREMADSLAARGITAITGQVVAGADPFTDAPLGFGWSWDDLGEAYSAGVEDLFFNEGFARVIVRGGPAPDRPATAIVSPATRYPAVHLAVHTGWTPDSVLVAGDGDVAVPIVTRRAELTTALDTLANGILVSGWIAPNAVDTLVVVFPDQRTAYLAALTEALEARGITVGRTTRKATRCGAVAPAAPLDTLFTYQSPPLRDVMRAMAKPSQNQIAELLLKTLGLERTGVGRADSGVSVVARQLLAWGAEPDGFVIRDGSGLSRYDYLTPETIVRVLAAIRHDTAFAAFYDALPIAGVDGTIAHRMRGTAAEGNVHAKTGYVANARSLSGYVTSADGRMLIFSALCNNWTVSVREIERVQDTIAERLAMLTVN